ncbi:MAG: bifunctional aspartate kinase/homoserine dehydrogenase I [Gammaproteobacteria bacterium]
MDQWQVHKFGGTSLADAECFRRVANILHQQEGARQAVVVSAMGGMTDALLGAVAAAEESAESIDSGLAAIAKRYTDTLDELLNDDGRKAELTEAMDAELADATDILQAAALVKSATTRSRDIVAGLGELWSARLLAAFLGEQTATDPQSRAVGWVDARQLITVEWQDMGPAVLWDQCAANVEQVFRYDGPTLAVVTGFIASDAEGLQTNLGRNGSDFSASIVGSLLGAASINIWTDVAGVMSADPNRVPDATIIHELSYNEAMELAYFGAKVIHPQTMSPAVSRDIPIYIRSTFKPGARGSRVSSILDDDNAIKGITSVDEIALVNLEGAGMIGVPGTADRLFGALHEAGISVILISQASSEHSICFAIANDKAAEVEAVVQAAFAEELHQGQIQRIEVYADCSIIAVVGDGMAGMPGVAARFLSSIANAGINVRAIAQGSSERNISVVVDGDSETRALRAAHAGFYLSAETISIGLIGPGNVGSALLGQMAAQMEELRNTFNLDYRVRAIATSSRMLLAEQAVDISNWADEFEANAEPLDWERLLAHVNAEHLPHAVMVDCTASDEVAGRYLDWFKAGLHVVTPNKKAQSNALAYYDELQSYRRKHNLHFLYETSVGAALPVVQTLRDLRETGDSILSIQGIFSGTLAYLFNVYDGSRPFSQIVVDARNSGYTEPDPRDDLSGMDVARKLNILARELGLRLELADIEIESLVPAGLEDISVDEFLQALPDHDEVMLERYQKSSRADEVQRYVGKLDSDGKATVRLESLPSDHSFAHINLTDNVVQFVTGRYSENPLVVQGPGAGPAVTAAGVFADLLRLARYLGAPG